jgi:small subunit ribosomal protein S16
MLIIRYRRAGKRNNPHYKIVVAEKSSPIKGKFVELLGSYNPHNKEVSLKENKIREWIRKGAQCSDSVHNLLVSKGIIKDAKRTINTPNPAEESEESKEGGQEEKGENADKQISDEGNQEESQESSQESKKENNSEKEEEETKKEKKGKEEA